MAELAYPGTSKPSGDENSEQGEEAATINEAEACSRRSYKCVYCKMGFTNAQALGGHMNIHRKDRANLSAPSSSSSSRQAQIPVSISIVLFLPAGVVASSMLLLFLPLAHPIWPGHS